MTEESKCAQKFDQIQPKISTSISTSK